MLLLKSPHTFYLSPPAVCIQCFFLHVVESSIVDLCLDEQRVQRSNDGRQLFGVILMKLFEKVRKQHHIFVYFGVQVQPMV